MAQTKQVEIRPDAIHIEWADSHVSDYPHRYLRGTCPCAACVNEMTGKRMVGIQQVPEDVRALDWMPVGRYGLQFLWSDGHDTGIYPLAALRENLCLCEVCLLRRGELR